MSEARSEASEPNRLIHETSPYLLQHAHNPVDWYPWGPEALERARAEDRPVLLSIGYAACHWCHVMERESFEDPVTAALMNEHFVCIKVDREERPDLDAIYMDAVQAMTGSGGWPMTVFLTSDGRPFYAGTYFPPEDRHGLPAFKRVLGALAETWRERRQDIESQGSRVAQGIGRVAALRESTDPLADDVLRGAFAALSKVFDPEWGGFGGAPKFPQPMTLEFLLRCHLRGYEGALEMVTTTLDRMAGGGVYDHVAGGFHRYSTDGRWHVPHFEKMLYDNAQLLRLYARAWQVSGNEWYRRVATETGEYMLREMRHPSGGFFSSQDADSEGVEGRFYVWSWDEIVDAAAEAVSDPRYVTDSQPDGEATQRAAEAIARFFGAVPEGNWEGANIVWRPFLWDQVDRSVAESGLSRSDFEEAMDRTLQLLLQRREGRVRPATDDKILAGWNGLAISALVEAGRAMGEPHFIEAAVAAAEFVLANLRDGDGRLLRSWREGRPGRPGFVDDQALMASACLTLYETTFDVRFFREARALADDLVRLFRDPEGGGFFQTGSDAEELVVRPKELFDNAVPSGNSVAAEVLQRLAHLTGESERARAGVSALRLVRDLMARAPSATGHALCALDLYLSKVREVAIAGDPASDEEAGRLVRTVHRRFAPNVVLAGGPPGGEGSKEIPLLADRALIDGRAAAYVCEGFVCRLPVTEPEDLAAQLSAS